MFAFETDAEDALGPKTLSSDAVTPSTVTLLTVAEATVHLSVTVPNNAPARLLLVESCGAVPSLLIVRLLTEQLVTIPFP